MSLLPLPNSVTLSKALNQVIAAVVLLLVSLTCTAQTPLNQYLLDSGDSISISVFGEPELSKQLLINNSGIINYPFLGELKVTGLTPSELEKTITNGLKPDYLINPNVSVAIISYRPFFIEGQVKSAGAYSFQPGLSIAKAVVLAGGFTERASQDKVFIVRASDPSQIAIKVNLNTKVQPGDIITVKQSFF